MKELVIRTYRSSVAVTALMGLCTLVLLGGGIFKWQSVLDLPVVGSHPFLWALVFALGTLLMGFTIRVKQLEAKLRLEAERLEKLQLKAKRPRLEAEQLIKRLKAKLQIKQLEVEQLRLEAERQKVTAKPPNKDFVSGYYGTVAESPSKIILIGLARRLVVDQFLDEAKAQELFDKSLKDRTSFISLVVYDKLVSSRDVAHVASEEFGVPLVDIDSVELNPDIVKLIDERMLKSHRALPIFRRGNRLFVAVSDPTNLSAIDDIRFKTKLNTEAILVEEDKLAKVLERAIEFFDTTMKGLANDFGETEAELLKVQRDAARALMEKQKQLERENLIAGHGQSTITSRNIQCAPPSRLPVAPGQSAITSPNHQLADHPSSLKLSTVSQPLPHDGLFIRRNSSFGTQLTTGLKELIAQGVMIQQTHIRFDEFVALNTEGIPSPTSNHALAVSHGIAAIPAPQQHDSRATHYLEIALKTANIAPGGHLDTQTPPVNYIFVVDVSGSMHGEKIDTVKASIRELFTLLRPDDVIGVTAFDHQVKTLLESTPKQNLSADQFGRIINSLVANGGTDINLGLSVSIDEMRRYRGVQRVNQLFLFSDGNPYNGETNWIKIRQNVAAKLRQSAATDGNIRLSTLVFGSDANKVELDKLAGITGGQSIFVIEPKQDVIQALQQELARRTHLAAINVQMQIEISPDIQILHFYGHDLITDPTTRAAVERQAEITGQSVETNYGVKSQPDLIKEDKGIRVFVPNLAVGETYWVVFELAVPEELTSTAFGKATVQYFDTFARENQKPQFDLSPIGTIEPHWVIQHALGLWTSEIASYALSDVEARDINTAEKRIQTHISVLESARSYLPAQAPIKLVDDIITLNKLLSLAQNLHTSNNLAYLNYGLRELEGMRNGFLQMKESLS